jgi:hypothetical protein
MLSDMGRTPKPPPRTEDKKPPTPAGIKRLKDLAARMRSDADAWKVSESERATLNLEIESALLFALGADHHAFHPIRYGQLPTQVRDVLSPLTQARYGGPIGGSHGTLSGGHTEEEVDEQKDLLHRAGLVEQQIKTMESELPPPPTSEPAREVKPAEAPAADKVVALLRRFPAAARELRHRHNSRKPLEITDEYDVQDLLRVFLRVLYDDIRTEEPTPSVAGKSARLDLLLKGQRVGLEAKMTREGLGGKELGTQLIDDIRRYREHRDCETLVFFIYDPEFRVRNPESLQDLAGNEGGVEVRIVIAPS